MSSVVKLAKIFLKNDYKKILIWLIAIIYLNIITSIAYPAIYSSSEQIKTFAIIVNNPALKGLLGDMYPTSIFNQAHIFSQEMLLMSSIIVAVMNIYFSIRFTRCFEDDGLIEIVNAKPLAKHTTILSAISLVFLLNLILFIVITTSLFFVSLDGATFTGKILYGLIIFAIGIFFSSIGFLSSKLFNNSSSSYSFSYVYLLVSYLIRAIGDVLYNPITYLSPLGWVSKTKVFYKDNFIFVILLIIISIIIYLIGIYIYKNNDIGFGFFNLNNGKKNASRLIKTNVGLIFRLKLNQLLIWILSFFVLTAVFGTIFSEFETFLELDIIKQFFGNDTTDFSKTIIFYIIQVITIFGLIPTINIILKLAKEEKTAQIENIYSRISREKYLISHVGFSFIISIVLQLLIMISAYSTGHKFILDNMSFSNYLLANLSFIPVYWFIIGLTVLLLGFNREAIKYIWYYYVFIFVVFYLEEILKLPKIIMYLSPIYHIDPNTPNIITSLIFSVLSIACIFLGLTIYKKRRGCK